MIAPIRNPRRVAGPSLAFMLLLALCPATHAQQATMSITKIDPPNWYATFPKPLLLVRGEGLAGATFSLSDPHLRVEHTAISENGHWAQLWLSTSPAKPETVQIHARRGSAHVDASYTFAARRPSSDGFAGFSPRDIIYLIMPDRFADGDLTNDGPLAHSSSTSLEAAAERVKPMGWHGGDLSGIAQHLDYIQSLGATAVWSTPVYQNHAPQAYHGYHATDYYAVDEHYGTLADLQSLTRQLHARRMKLILDIVPNHVGPLHPWVADSPAPDWFHGTLAHHVKAEYNFNALINPHAPERDRSATLKGWFVDELPDMNTDSPAVAQYLRQNCVWWLEQTGADAFRIDTFPYVNREFWHGFTAELRALYPHVTEVGEVSDGNPEITSAFADGVTRAGVDTGLYTPFDFPLYYAARDVFAGGQPMTRLTSILGADELYPHPERLVPFLGNHDTSRFAQAVTDPTLQKLAYAFLLTTRGTPQIYSGDELAVPGGDDPDNRRDFPVAAFNPTVRSPQQAQLFDWIAQLAKIRRDNPALACGAQQILQAGTDTLVYLRYANVACDATSPQDNQPILVALQRGTPTPIQLDLQHTAASTCAPHNLLPGDSKATLRGQILSLQLDRGVGLFGCR